MERKSISSNQSGRYSQQSPESVDRMKDHLSHNIIDDIDLNSPGVVTKLDLLLRKNKNIKNMSLRDVSSICPEQKDVTSILVGLWALDFL
ncbi:hypothetical protein ACVW6E_001046 [Escherichia coli]